jgi:hypothetical protein
VVDAGTLCADLRAEWGACADAPDPAALRSAGADLFVTPRDVDSCSAAMAKVLGLGISCALHRNVSAEDIEQLTAGR